MPIVNELASQGAIPAPGAGIAQGISQGLDAGLALASAKDKSEKMGLEIDNLKTQQINKQGEYILDPLIKAKDTKDPKVQRLLINVFGKRYEEQTGRPMGKDVLDSLGTDSGQQTIEAIINKHSQAKYDAADLAALNQELVKNGNFTDLASAGDWTAKILSTQATIQNKEEGQSLGRDKLDQAGEIARLKAEKADNGIAERTEKKQDKAYENLTKGVESFRGNRVAQQASNDVYSAEKALAIAKNNPDKLTTQDLNLLASEIAKIATGGVPGEHGVKVLVPDNYKTRAADISSFASGKPTPAEMGDFVRKNITYLEDMTSIARERLSQYQTNIAQGYINKVSDEDREEFIASHPEIAKRLNLKNGLPEGFSAVPLDQTPTTQVPSMLAAPQQKQAGPMRVDTNQLKAIKAFKAAGKKYSDIPAQLRSIISPADFDGVK